MREKKTRLRFFTKDRVNMTMNGSVGKLEQQSNNNDDVLFFLNMNDGRN